MGATAYDTNPYEIDPLAYLASVPEPDPKKGITLSAEERREHFQAIKLSLLRVSCEDPATFDLALTEVSKKLGIKAKTVKEELARLAEPPAAKEARELLEKIGQTRMLRLAQDYQDSKLWFGIVAREEKLLVNSERALLTLDQVPEGLIVKDHGFDLCRFSKDGHRALCERWGGSRLYVAS